MPSKYCEKLPRCKNAWWCATDYKPSKNVKCFDAMTNYDRIISKAPEELAGFFGTLPCCPPSEDVEELCFPLDSCEGTDFKVKCWLKWLKQEVTD